MQNALVFAIRDCLILASFWQFASPDSRWRVVILARDERPEVTCMAPHIDAGGRVEGLPMPFQSSLVQWIPE